MAKKSSLKRARGAIKKRDRNKKAKRAFKTAIKRVEFLMGEKKDPEEVKKVLNKAVSLIDKATSKGALHKNNASRRKSQVTTKVNNYLKSLKT